MLPALARVRAVAKTPLGVARRWGSGGGGLPPKPNFQTPTNHWPDAFWTGWALNGFGKNMFWFGSSKTVPTGCDMTGYEGLTGKYIAFIFGVLLVQGCIPDKKAHHAAH